MTRKKEINSHEKCPFCGEGGMTRKNSVMLEGRYCHGFCIRRRWRTAWELAEVLLKRKAANAQTEEN
jgi:hypothetical protein